MFQRRHYEWLAEFAATYLSEPEIANLSNLLAMENSRFKPDRFAAKINELRSASLPRSSESVSKT